MAPRGARLSVNVNKVATLRNSRGGAVPSVIEAVRVCIASGAPGITVHPRADARHITTADVHDIAAELEPLRDRVEFNIEGDPRPDLLDLFRKEKPHQCTLVPVRPGNHGRLVERSPRPDAACGRPTALLRRHGPRSPPGTIAFSIGVPITCRRVVMFSIGSTPSAGTASCV